MVLQNTALRKNDPPTIALVAMPFAELTMPILEMGLAHRDLIAAGAHPTSFSFHLQFFDFLSRHDTALADLLRYQSLRNNKGVGDWIFAVPPFCNVTPETDAAFADMFVAEGRSAAEILLYARRVRSLARRFLEQCADAIERVKPSQVYFFLQDYEFVPSLALSKLLVDRSPALTVSFVGDSCREPFGTALRSGFPYLTSIQSQSIDSKTIVSSFIYNSDRDLANSHHHDTETFSQETIPNYDEYFERLAQSHVQDKIWRMLWIPFRTSQGCWWGDKVRCSFCALPEPGKAFNVLLDPNKAAQQIVALAQRYACAQFNIHDLIQSRSVQTLMECIDEQDAEVKLYLLVHPSISKEQIRIIARGGHEIQLGLETLSTRLSKKMRKGTNAFQCMRVLRWCAEFGARANWNLIYDVPGWDLGDYEELLHVIPFATTFAPPDFHRFQLQVGSPLFDQVSSSARIAKPWYAIIYSDYPISVANGLASEFDREGIEDAAITSAIQAVRKLVEVWRERAAQNSRRLTFRDLGTSLIISDFRVERPSARFVLKAAERAIYLACVDGIDLSRLREHVAAGGWSLALEDLKAFLEEAVAEKIMFGERGHYLALAIPEVIVA